jgi:hypothetical protein
MEAVRLQDEFQHFASEVPADALLERSEQRIEGGGGDSPLEKQILRLLAEQPCGWGALSERVAASRARVGLAVRDLLQAGCITLKWKAGTRKT